MDYNLFYSIRFWFTAEKTTFALNTQNKNGNQQNFYDD